MGGGWGAPRSDRYPYIRTHVYLSIRPGKRQGKGQHSHNLATCISSVTVSPAEAPVRKYVMT